MKLFKKIEDERLIMRNLKIIKIVYGFQSLGILAILIYEAVKNGLQAAVKSPLAWLFYLSNTLLVSLSMEIDVAHGKEVKSPKRRLILALVPITVISVFLARLLQRALDLEAYHGILYGATTFIVVYIRVFYLYYLRKKAMENKDD